MPSRSDAFWQKAGILFGVGDLPIMPGTYATFIAAVILIPISFAGDIARPAILGLLVVLCSVAGYWAVPVAERHYDRKDPQPYVLDEMAGYFLSVIFLPDTVPLWTILIASFFLFRIFDVAKPFPINGLQCLPGALGVVADDLMAGIYTNLCIQLFVHVILPRIT